MKNDDYAQLVRDLRDTPVADYTMHELLERAAAAIEALVRRLDDGKAAS